MKELPNKSWYFFNERLQIGYDLDCPGLSFVWHRCHKYFQLEIYPFYINVYYAKDWNKE